MRDARRLQRNSDRWHCSRRPPWTPAPGPHRASHTEGCWGRASAPWPGRCRRCSCRRASRRNRGGTFPRRRRYPAPTVLLCRGCVAESMPGWNRIPDRKAASGSDRWSSGWPLAAAWCSAGCEYVVGSPARIMEGSCAPAMSPSSLNAWGIPGRLRSSAPQDNCEREHQRPDRSIHLNVSQVRRYDFGSDRKTTTSDASTMWPGGADWWRSSPCRR